MLYYYYCNKNMISELIYQIIIGYDALEDSYFIVKHPFDRPIYRVEKKNLYKKVKKIAFKEYYTYNITFRIYQNEIIHLILPNDEKGKIYYSSLEM